MPEKLEKELEASADKRGLTGKRKDAYVYGGMRRIAHWKPKREKSDGQRKALGKL